MWVLHSMRWVTFITTPPRSLLDILINEMSVFPQDCSNPHSHSLLGHIVKKFSYFQYVVLVFLIWIPQTTMSRVGIIKGDTNGSTISRSCWKQPSGGQHEGEPPDLGCIVTEGCLLNQTFCPSWTCACVFLKIYWFFYRICFVFLLCYKMFSITRWILYFDWGTL